MAIIGKMYDNLVSEQGADLLEGDLLGLWYEKVNYDGTADAQRHIQKIHAPASV
jgi:hypothetical protein